MVERIELFTMKSNIKHKELADPENYTFLLPYNICFIDISLHYLPVNCRENSLSQSIKQEKGKFKAFHAINSSLCCLFP